LRAFSGVDTGAPGIISDLCIYGIRAVYGFFSRLRATPVVVGHQVTVPPGTVSSVPSSMGEEVTSEAREYARISAGTFQLKWTINFVPGVTIVSQVLSYFFTTMMVYYSIKWGLGFY